VDAFSRLVASLDQTSSDCEHGWQRLCLDPGFADFLVGFCVDSFVLSPKTSEYDDDDDDGPFSNAIFAGFLGIFLIYKAIPESQSQVVVFGYALGDKFIKYI